MYNVNRIDCTKQYWLCQYFASYMCQFYVFVKSEDSCCATTPAECLNVKQYNSLKYIVQRNIQNITSHHSSWWIVQTDSFSFSVSRNIWRVRTTLSWPPFSPPEPCLISSSGAPAPHWPPWPGHWVGTSCHTGSGRCTGPASPWWISQMLGSLQRTHLSLPFVDP